MNEAQRLQRFWVYEARDGQPIVLLVTFQRGTRCRTQNTINLIGIISEVLQCALHVRDHLIWRQILVTIDRLVKGIGRVERVIAPGRVPPAGIPTPITPVNQNDHVAVMPPPITVAMMLPVIVVFFLAQKAFVEGVTLTGVKG